MGGKPGDYITVARRRGREWFVGSITGWNGQELDLPLEFLGRGDFVAEIYSDAPDADDNPDARGPRREARHRRRRAESEDGAGGGQAIRLRPAQ